VQNSRLLSVAGAVGYEVLLKINRWYNGARKVVGLPYYSLSQAIKARVKSACTFISNFEQALVDEARRGGFDGVVCGHIHKAEMRSLSGVEYLNCGDWVESCTMLVEHDDGRIELIDGLAFLARHDAAKAMREGGDDDSRELVPAVAGEGDDAEDADPWLETGIAFRAVGVFSGAAK
jgi:hypothetical protein